MLFWFAIRRVGHIMKCLKSEPEYFVYLDV